MIPLTVDTTLDIISPQTERTWHARLPNGRPVLAFRPTDSPILELAVGARVPARLTVGDFSRALILTKEESSAQVSN